MSCGRSLLAYCAFNYLPFHPLLKLNHDIAINIILFIFNCLNFIKQESHLHRVHLAGSCWLQEARITWSSCGSLIARLVQSVSISFLPLIQSVSISFFSLIPSLITSFSPLIQAVSILFIFLIQFVCIALFLFIHLVSISVFPMIPPLK